MTEVKFGRVVSLVNAKEEGRSFRLGLEAIEPGTGRLVDEPNTDYEGDGSAFEPGDVLFGKLRPYLAKVWLADRPGAAVGDFHVYRPSRALVPAYLKYVLLARNFLDPVVSSVFGAKMPRADWDFIRNVSTYVPSLDEQRQVVAFLDSEAAKAEALIAEQEGLVAVLRERRTALVSRAVASGLDQSVEMEEISVGATRLKAPTHWRVMPLRYALSYQEGPGILAVDFRDAGVPLLRVSSVRGAVATLDGCNYLDAEMVNTKWSHFRVARGDLLISASASMGTVSKVETEDVVGAIPYTGIIKITPGAMAADFIRWFMVSSEFTEQVEALKTGSTIQHFGPSHLAQMRVALPPADEQNQIADYLDEQVEKIDALIAEAEGIVVVAKERRSALITAAVTGQIDVRGAA